MVLKSRFQFKLVFFMQESFIIERCWNLALWCMMLGRSQTTQNWKPRKTGCLAQRVTLIVLSTTLIQLNNNPLHMVTVYAYGIQDTVFKLRSIQKYIELVVWPSKMIQQCTTMAALDVMVFVENYNEVRDLSYLSIDIANVENKIIMIFLTCEGSTLDNTPRQPRGKLSHSKFAYLSIEVIVS